LPFPSVVCPVHAHQSTSCAAGARRRRPEAPPHPHRPPSAPEFALEVSNLLLPLIRPLLSFCPHNSLPELIRAAASPPHRVPRSLVLLRRRGAHGRVRQIALSAFELFPKPLEPHHGHPLVSGETSPWSRAASPSSVKPSRRRSPPSNPNRAVQITGYRFAPAPPWRWARPVSLSPPMVADNRPRLSVTPARPLLRACPRI
jgi:hypothetical protein